MGRQYVDVKVCSDDRCSEWVIAFIDTGADLTVISTSISEKLGIVLEKTEREWAASDGDELYSPITQVEIIEDGGGERVSLDEVLVDDRPLDKESNEDVLLGLDYLQKAKKVLYFDD